MAEKVSVRVPLTARQKAQIRNATGKTINAFKVESGGGMSPRTKVSLAARTVAGKYLAKAPAKFAGRFTGKSLK